MSLRAWLQKHLSPSDYLRLVRTAEAMLGWWHRNDLNRLALLFHTDKWGSHWYTQRYQRYFQPKGNWGQFEAHGGVLGSLVRLRQCCRSDRRSPDSC